MGCELPARLAAAWPAAAWQDVTVLLAVSGGADSVALLRAMVELKRGGEGRLIVAHLNHGLRPEAETDQRFVEELCQKIGVACEVGKAKIDGALAGDGLEAAARQARYQFLAETAGRVGARYVVTAHTADDQAETILHRILRGTGMGGLSGMGRTRPLAAATLLRPLLAFRREELLDYLRHLGQPFCRDASNEDRRFTRNRIRHELLPQLAEQFNPGVADALLRLGRLAGEAQAIIDRLVDTLGQRHVTIEPPCGARLDIKTLADQPAYLVGELLIAVWRQRGWPEQSMGAAQWEELSAMARGRTATRKKMFPGGVVAEIIDDGLRLTRVAR
jgi:tRNA(Ile)-lysidine synthase